LPPSRPVRLLFTLAILLSSAAGCVLIDPTPPFGTERISGTGPDRVLRNASPALQVQGPLTLEEALRVAKANNPGLAAAGHEEEAASARRDEVAGRRWPVLGATGGYDHSLDPRRFGPWSGGGQPGMFGRDLFSSGLRIGVPLFTGGRLTAEIDAEDHLREAAAHIRVRTHDELVFEVSKAFFGILAQRKVVESLEFSRNTLGEHLERMRKLIEAKKAAEVDRLRTEVRLADVEQRLLKEHNALSMQTRLLAVLLGLESPRESFVPKGELSRPGASGRRPETEVSRALALRPDYLAAKATLEAQAKRVDAARAGHWPTVSLSGSYGWNWAASPTDRPSGTPEAWDAGIVGIEIVIPLFEGGSVQARVRKERARLLAAQERYRQMRLRIRLEVETSVSDLQTARMRVGVMEKAIEQARESLRIEREKYGHGKGTNVDVLDAQSALLEAQTAHFRALADYNVAMARLALATGEQ
jgi:outer membrane protein TolC